MKALIGRGLLGGVLLAAGLALWDHVASRGHLFGMKTMLVGVTAGGLLLSVGFMLAAISFRLASQARAVTLRRWMLGAAVLSGAAGMTCGCLAAALWFAAGHPWSR